MSIHFKKIKHFLLTHFALILIMIGAVLLIGTGIYAVHLLQHPTQPAPTRTTKTTKRPLNAIVDWMTISYVAKTYAVPEPVLLKALNLTAAQANKQSIKAIATQQHQTSAQIISKLVTTIQKTRGTK